MFFSANSSSATVVGIRGGAAGLLGKVDLLRYVTEDRLEAGGYRLAGIALAELQRGIAVLGEVQGGDQRGGVLGQQRLPAATSSSANATLAAWVVSWRDWRC